MSKSRRLRYLLFTTAAVLLLVVGIDYFSSFFYETRTEAHITIVRVDNGSVSRAIVTLPEYLMSGSIVTEAFKPYLLPDNALVAVDYAERGIDLIAIYSKVQAALDSLHPQTVIFYGASMGGSIVTRLAAISARSGMLFGKITLILDTAPLRAADVKRPCWLFSLSCLYRGGIVSSVVLALSTILSQFPPASPNASLKLVREAHKKLSGWVCRRQPHKHASSVMFAP